MTLKVFSHAKENYIERVMGRQDKTEDEWLRNEAEKEIKKAFNNPDNVYQGDDDKPPVYIRGDVAVIINPSHENCDGIAAVTVYNKLTFEKKYGV